MTSSVSVIFLLDGDGGSGLEKAGAAFLERLLEATILLTGSRARVSDPKGELAALCKRLDVGFSDCSDPKCAVWTSPDASASDFYDHATEDYETVAMFAGRIPSCFAAAAVPPFSYSALAEWYVRAVVCPTVGIDNGHRPYFLGGRIHLADLGPFRIDCQTSTDGLVDQIGGLAVSLAPTGGAIVVSLAAALLDGGAGESIGAILDELTASPGLAVKSVRQFADANADVSYEHAIPVAAIQKIAAQCVEAQELRPFAYDLGYLSPSEQLYLIATYWEASLQKAKLGRNATSRTPIGPSQEIQTDATVTRVKADEVGKLVADLTKLLYSNNVLPPSVAIHEGAIAVADLLATLAGGFGNILTPVDMPLRKGRLAGLERVKPELLAKAWPLATSTEVDRLVELLRLQQWTFKPLQDFAGD